MWMRLGWDDGMSGCWDVPARRRAGSTSQYPYIQTGRAAGIWNDREVAVLSSAPQFRLPDAQVAQLVEQRTENPRVGGSIPSLGTITTPSSSVAYVTRRVSRVPFT